MGKYTRQDYIRAVICSLEMPAIVLAVAVLAEFIGWLLVTTFPRFFLGTTSLPEELGFLPGESYGVGNRAVSDKAHRAYELEKVVKKALAMHNNPTPTFRGVDYDGLIVRYTDDPAPECVIIEGEMP